MQHVYDIHGISKFFFFQLNGGNFKIHTAVQSDSNNIGLFRFHFFFLCYAKVSDYRAVRLASGRSMDTHPLQT